MRSKKRPGRIPRYLLVGLTVCVTLILTYGGFTSETIFGAYNTDWEGTADLRSFVDDSVEETFVAQNTRTYTNLESNSTVSFILSPESTYTAQETAQIEKFVRSGGTLVIAEDYGNNSNRLLEQLGADVRFSGDRLRDERNYTNSPNMPRAYSVTEHHYAKDIDTITLNYGTTVEPNETTVLFQTSSFAYLDSNQNGILDAGESPQKYPVVAQEQFGNGEIVAVGDPSMFINVMLKESDNRKFAQNLLSNHSAAVFDISHRGSQPVLINLRMSIRESTVLQVILGFAAIFFVSYLGSFRRIIHMIQSGKGEEIEMFQDFDQKTIEAWMRERYPEWDAEQIQRVSEQISGKKGD